MRALILIKCLWQFLNVLQELLLTGKQTFSNLEHLIFTCAWVVFAVSFIWATKRILSIPVLEIASLFGLSGRSHFCRYQISRAHQNLTADLCKLLTGSLEFLLNLFQDTLQTILHKNLYSEVEKIHYTVFYTKSSYIQKNPRNILSHG